MFTLNGKDVVAKVAKDPDNGLFEIEKKVFERLGESNVIALFQYYPFEK